MSATRRSADRLADRVLALTAGRRLAPAIAALLALLVAAILLAFNAVSAEETPTHQAAINDDPNLNRPLPTTTCDHSINSDATCDLSMRLWNRHTTTEATFTLLEVGVNGAFDSSTITPDNTERYSTQTLGDCPCEYTVPPRGYETFRVTIRVGTMTDGYRTSNIRIFFGADHIRSQTPLNEYRLRLVDVTTPPDPTVITVGEITDHTVALTWTADSHASSYIVFWWPKGAMYESDMGATNDKTYKITELDADTLYVIKVQALVRGKNLASDQIDVRTTGAPEPSVITVGTVTDTTIALTWTADSDATSFAVSWWPKADATSLSTATTTNQARTIRSLTPSTLYVLKVQANVGSATVDSAEVEVTTKVEAPVITVGKVTDTTIAMTWTTDSDATSFAVSWWPKADATSPNTATTTDVAHTIASLTPSTLYVLKVQATVGSKTADSAEVEATTKAAAPTKQRPQCSQQTADSDGVIDYDQDDDGLIEICNLTQLDAIRHDLNGDGAPDVYPTPYDRWGNKTPWTGDYSEANRATNYRAVFSTPKANMGCQESAALEADRVCQGYELITDLDFDENRNGKRDDTYNRNQGWKPISGHTYWHGGDILTYHSGAYYGNNLGATDPRDRATMFQTVLEGNGHTISNLFMHRHIELGGLVAYMAPGSEIRNLGLIRPEVGGAQTTGSLVGFIEGGRVSASYAKDAVVAATTFAGGLIGIIWRGAVIETYATGSVSIPRAYEVRAGRGTLGGLVGLLNGRARYNQGMVGPTGKELLFSFATAHLVARSSVDMGGLVGKRLSGTFAGTYANGKLEMKPSGYGPRRPRNAVLGGILGEFKNPENAMGQTRVNYSTSELISTHWLDDVGGFVGLYMLLNTNKVTNMTHSYWDKEASGTTKKYGFSNRRKQGINSVNGKTTAQLQAPTNANAYDAGSIYEHWKVTIDGVAIDPWDFGTSSQYPILDYCAEKPGIDTADGQPYCPLRDYNQRQ